MTSFPKLLDYTQPDFYRFTEDSVLLAKYVAKYIELDDSESTYSILDVGCGCGVVGLEIFSLTCKISSLDFIEAQPDFIPCLQNNINTFVGERISCKVFMTTISDLKCNKKYSIVVSNPPYYLSESNRASSDVRRTNCRQFTLSSVFQWFNYYIENLQMGSVVFVLEANDLFRSFLLLHPEIIVIRERLSKSVSILKLSIPTLNIQRTE